MAKHNELGRWGEEVACRHLILQGYAIAGRNWRMGRYEIDIIAIKGDCICFVEVKTRSNMDEDPLEAIDDRKIHFMAASAKAYITNYDEYRQARFDVFGICGTPDNYTVEYIPDAFEPPIKSYR